MSHAIWHGIDSKQGASLRADSSKVALALRHPHEDHVSAVRERLAENAGFVAAVGRQGEARGLSTL